MVRALVLTSLLIGLSNLALAQDSGKESSKNCIDKLIIEQKSAIVSGASRLEILECIREQIIEVRRDSQIPPNTVAAFNLSKCPDGWDNFRKSEGRFVLGVGKGPLKDEANLGFSNGKEFIAMSSDQLPSHSHVAGSVSEERFYLRKNINGETIERRVDAKNLVDFDEDKRNEDSHFPTINDLDRIAEIIKSIDTKPELPANFWGEGNRPTGVSHTRDAIHKHEVEIENAGKGEAVQIMPPFTTLLFCYKQ